jgi:hypothetical protein
MDKAILDRVFYEVSRIFQVKLLQKVCPVMFHGPDAYG